MTKYDVIKAAKLKKDKALSTIGAGVGATALIAGIEIGERSRKRELPALNKDIRHVYEPVREAGSYALDAFNY